MSRKKDDKPRIAFFDFACCEGCQLTVLELGEALFDMFDGVEVVAWREVLSGGSDTYDIAFCEGSIATRADLERIEKIRKRAKILVALGSCASIGCHNTLGNQWPTRVALEEIYGETLERFGVIQAQPVSAVVPVDYRVHGCPLSLPEFVEVFKHILTGQEYSLPNQPVCVECKLNDNLCVFEKGLVCLGPVTRCGCNAICTSYGDVCHGCRGLVDEANLQAALKVLATHPDRLHAIMKDVVERAGAGKEDISSRFSIYDNWPESKMKEVDADET